MQYILILMIIQSMQNQPMIYFEWFLTQKSRRKLMLMEQILRVVLFWPLLICHCICNLWVALYMNIFYHCFMCGKWLCMEMNVILFVCGWFISFNFYLFDYIFGHWWCCFASGYGTISKSILGVSFLHHWGRKCSRDYTWLWWY